MSTRGGYVPRGRPTGITRPVQRPTVPPFRGTRTEIRSMSPGGGARPFVSDRGGFSGRGRGAFTDRREPFERRSAPFDRRSADLDEKIREQRQAIALQEQLLRQQQLIE